MKEGFKKKVSEWRERISMMESEERTAMVTAFWLDKIVAEYDEQYMKDYSAMTWMFAIILYERMNGDDIYE